MFGKLLTNQKIAHKIVKPYVYKALREGLKTHDNGKIQNLRGFGSLSLRSLLLKEEYPMARAYIKALPGGKRFVFKAKVQAYEGPARFVKGFSQDTEVIGSEDFKSYVKSIP